MDTVVKKGEGTFFGFNVQDHWHSQNLKHPKILGWLFEHML